ncbi:hybrid sensor histidine kinase/response regulator transcription factor [Confluentibacter citreus]|uniref:hybrid sensor histidine kinase/response regulator transcription factor n=1 Tax=Confluentibacter citreus TaxID=2007307 RepID=UPI000C288C98|nr:two-component regulator propeller domain-containing protein [Confluentibacter citreus]
MKSSFVFKIFLILSFHFSIGLIAQDTDLHFEHVNYDNGFPQSMISSIEQTENGFIWIGTENGLVRYDGYSFLRYVRDINKKNSISNNHINVIYEDVDKNLWIGTNNGINYFDKKKNTFLGVDILPIKGGRNYISSIIEDQDNNLIIGTFGGVKRLNKEKFSLENISDNSNHEIFTRSRVLSLFSHNELGILVGTAQGLKCINPKSGELVELPRVFNENKIILSAKIWKIIEEKNGDLWFGTESMGAFLFSKKNNTIINFSTNNTSNSIASNWIHDMVIMDTNTIWFATDNGLSVYKKDKNKFHNYKHNQLNNYSISDNEVKSILKDRDGSIWLGTTGGGVNFFNQANLNFINISETIKPNFGLTVPMVSAIIKEGEDAIWAGTYGGGLNYLDLKNQKSYSYLINNADEKNTVNRIISLISKDKDNLLCGTINGVYQFNKSTKEFKKISLNNNNALPLNERIEITTLYLDNDDVWVGTLGSGLKKINKNGTVETYTADDKSLDNISDNFIEDIEHRNDGLWIATQNGLNFFDKKIKKFTAVYKSNGAFSLSNNALTALFTDSKNRLWIGTDFGGLNYFDEKSQKFHLINKEMGFTDEPIKSISEDINGNLWVSSNGQLFKIKFKDFLLPFKDSNFEITSYSSKDGLISKEFSANCSMRLDNNNLVFGGSKGLTIFNPNKISKNTNQNDIVFTKLIVNNEEIAAGEADSPIENNITETSEITLNYDQRYVGLDFSALNYVKPESNIYSYKLDTSSRIDDWHDIGNQHSINLTALNTGTYYLKVKTSNEEGVWNPKIKILKITILPPWWKTWWAYLIYFILSITIMIIVVRFFKNRIEFKRALFLEHVENERQQELSQMKLEFFTNVSHEFRTPLTLISGPVEELIQSAEKDSNLERKLKTVKLNSDRLLKLVNELIDFRKAEKGSLKIYCEQQDIVAFCFDIYESFRGIATEKKMDYKFVLNINTAQVYFDKNQMEKVIYNLLSNAFKFTGKKDRITLAVEQRNDDSEWIDIKVKDNGIGIPEDYKTKIFNRFFQVNDRTMHNKGSGIGLALSKSIVELHHGEIFIQEEKDPNFKTIFIISLRKGMQHFKKSQIMENNFVSDDIEIPVFKVQQEIGSNQILQDEDIEHVDGSKKTIAVIDDNEEVLSFIFDILSPDYNIIKFKNGKLAINHMEKDIPDLVVCDVMMPEMDGIEFCKYLKTNQSTNHIPIILLTAKSSTVNRIEGLSTGADSYISKPFSIDVLKLNIANLLSSKEILRQKYSGRFIVDSDLEQLSSPEEIFISKLMEIIETKMENPEFDVNELVKEIGMSRTVLYKKVQTLTNHSVASLIKHIRLKKASDILKNTNYPVSEVAYMVGFNDRKHFSREFKKVFDVSPTTYKAFLDKSIGSLN